MYSVITPYIVPENLPKKVNIGDGLIMDSSVKLIKQKPQYVFSSRSDLKSEDIEKINSTKSLIVMGANTLKDNFKITPNFNLDLLEKIKVPIILMGIGLYGTNSETQNGLDNDSKTILNEIFTRFPYFSVRSKAGYEYLKRGDINEKNLIHTSCPVIFPVDNFDKKFQKNYQNIAVTITDRVLIDKQIGLFHFIKENYKNSKLTACFHQNYENNKLYEYLKHLGFEIFTSSRYEDFIEFYMNIDFHIGNRLHAHLKCLSLGVRSFLTPFDLRQLYFSQSLNFPLIDTLPNNNLENYDFNIYLHKRNEYKHNMDKFIKKVREFI
jgi:hypothetical protein